MTDPSQPQPVPRSWFADVFVGIYWQRYGWVGPGMTISGLGLNRVARRYPQLLPGTHSSMAQGFGMAEELAAATSARDYWARPQAS